MAAEVLAKLHFTKLMRLNGCTYIGVCAAMKTAASLSNDVTSSSSRLVRLTRHRDDDVTTWRRRREPPEVTRMTLNVTCFRRGRGEFVTSAACDVSLSVGDDVMDG